MNKLYTDPVQKKTKQQIIKKSKCNLHKRNIQDADSSMSTIILKPRNAKVCAEACRCINE